MPLCPMPGGVRGNVLMMKEAPATDVMEIDGDERCQGAMDQPVWSGAVWQGGPEMWSMLM